MDSLSATYPQTGSLPTVLNALTSTLPIAEFANTFQQPQSIIEGMIAFFRSGFHDPLGGKLDSFSDNFILQNLSLFTDVKASHLLHFPPGTRVFQLAAETVPEILQRQIQMFFPELQVAFVELFKTDPTCSPLSIIESITYEDVQTGVVGANVGTYHLTMKDGFGGSPWIIKRYDMSLERILAEMLRKTIGIPAVEIQWTSSGLSLVKPVPGLSLREISGNPLTEPRKKRWSAETIRTLGYAMGQEAALAYYLHLFSRHPENLIATLPDDLNNSEFVRTDLGQSLLPTRNPVNEALIPIWHLRRFFSHPGTDDYEKVDIFSRILEGFSDTRNKAVQGITSIRSFLEQTVDLPVPQMEGELRPPTVRFNHVTWIENTLLSGTDAEKTFDEIYNQFFQDCWEVPGWMEFQESCTEKSGWISGNFTKPPSVRSWSKESIATFAES